MMKVDSNYLTFKNGIAKFRRVLFTGIALDFQPDHTCKGLEYKDGVYVGPVEIKAMDGKPRQHFCRYEELVSTSKTEYVNDLPYLLNGELFTGVDFDIGRDGQYLGETGRDPGVKLPMNLEFIKTVKFNFGVETLAPYMNG